MKTREQVNAGLADFTDPTLLLTGSAGGLHALADLFDGQASFATSNAANLLRPIGIELTLHLGAAQTQLLKVGRQIDWSISLADAKLYAELIRAVAENDKPSHTYLDVPGNIELEIVVSKDEYDPATVFVN